MTAVAPRASFRANFIWLVTERGWRVVLGLVVSVMVTRYLGPADFGLLAYASSLCAIFGVLAGLGVDDVLARELVRHPEAARSLIRMGVKIKLLGAAVAFGTVMGVGWLWRPGDWHALALVAWVAAGFFFAPADVIDLWYQSRERMKRPVLARQVAMVGAAGVRLGLVAAGAPLWFFAAAVALETGLTASALGWLWAFGDAQPKETEAAWESPQRMRKMIRESAPLLVSGFLVVLTMQCDRLLLVRFSGEAAAGLYAAAARMTELMYVLPVALGAAFLPRLTALHGSDREGYLRMMRKVGLVVVAITGGLALGCSLVAAEVIPMLLGEAYRPTAAVWRVQVWTLVFIAIVSIRSRLWVVEGRTKWILGFSAITAAVDLAGNWWLIPTHGALGAAWSGVVAWGASALVWPWLVEGPARFMREWCGLANVAKL